LLSATSYTEALAPILFLDRFQQLELMCDDCFRTEIKKFTNQAQWTTFDLELSNKLGQGKLRQVQADDSKTPTYEKIFHIYRCSTCGQNWKLEEPDDHSDGHFLKLSTFQNLYKRRELTNRQVGLGLLIMVIVYFVVRAIF